MRYKSEGRYFFPEGLNDALIIRYRERQIKFRVLKLGCAANENRAREQQRARLFVTTNCLIDHDWIKAIFADEVK